ncbi:hypothetical protein [Clostridium sp. DL1XJH146]
MYDVRVYASYMMEESFEAYLQLYYGGWNYVESDIPGAEESYLLEYEDEESYQRIVVAYKEGTIYTLSVIGKFIDSEYDMNKSEEIEEQINQIKEFFEVF